MWILFLGDVTV